MAAQSSVLLNFCFPPRETWHEGIEALCMAAMHWPLRFAHVGKQSRLVCWEAWVYTWVQNMCCVQSRIKGQWAMLWTLQSWGMRLQLLSFMAGASRGCWPAQGGLLPGLQEAVVASLVEVVESTGPRNRGQGHNRLTNLCPKRHQAARNIWSQWIWKGFLEQTGHRQTSTSRVSGFRGPQQGVSQACVRKQIHRQWEAEGLRPDDHTTEWPQCCTLPWQSRNRP